MPEGHRVLLPFRARKKKPAEGETETAPVQKNLARPSAEEIFKQVAANARQELERPSIALALSGFGAGVFMGLSALGTAIAIRLLGPSPHTQILSRMFYPIGFIVVILGRSQLFTENTLYPVALVLAQKREFWNTVRLWSVVLPSNVLGALAFSCLASWTSAFEPETVAALNHLGMAAVAHPATQIFWSGVIGGWLIALAAWLVSGSHSITGSVMIIWMLTYIVGLGNFAHCIASSCEVFVPVLMHRIPWTEFPRWFFPAVSGNIVGGVGLVTILAYGQVMHGKVVEAVAKEGAETAEKSEC